MTDSPAPRRITRRSVIAGAGATAGTLGLAAYFGHWSSHAQQLTQGPATPNALGSPVPPEVMQYASDWPTPTGSLSATRAASTTPINSSNVTKLQVAWTMPIKAVSTFGGFSCNPVVIGTTVYVQDLSSNIFALDRASGKVIWQKNYNIPCGGPNGPAVGYGMVYAPLGDTAEMVALNADTGDEVWRVRLATADNEGIDMAPTVFDNTVYISTIPGTSKTFYNGGARGILYALDAKTGNTLWSWDTAADNLWGNARLNSGAGLWFPLSVDDDGNLYFGTGNPAPWPGMVADGTPYPNGSSRPGPNLYSSCMVSLDSKTGALRWYVQAKPHDLFDLDFQQTPVVASVAINGVDTPIAIGAGKTGTVICAGANSGKVIWQVPVGKHQNDTLEAVPPGETITVFPGDLGGVETPIAYADGTVFVPYLDFGAKYTDTGVSQSGGFDFSTGRGGLVALDATNGAIKWEVKLPSINTGGATVANDVVFTSTLDGLFRAYSTDDGKELWSYQAGAGFNAWPAIAGDMIFVGAAGPLVKPASAPAATPGGPAGVEPTAVGAAKKGAELIAFKLGS